MTSTAKSHIPNPNRGAPQMNDPSTVAIAEILRALNSLSGEELDQVASKIALLKANPFGASRPATATNAATNGHDELLLLAICEFFEAQGLEKCYPAMLRRASGYTAFKQKVEPIVAFLAKGAGRDSLTRTELMALFRLGISLLHQNMQSMQIAVSTRTMMNQIHRMPSVIELSFPGYARQGLLRLVIKRK